LNNFFGFGIGTTKNSSYLVACYGDSLSVLWVV
jgi:hypothetical protein